MNRILVALSVAAIGVAVASPARALDKVLIGYFGSDATLAAFIAKDQGYFEAHGIDATVQQMSGNSTAVPVAIAADSVQVAVTSFPTLVLAAENGIDVRILAGTTVSSPGLHVSALVVRPELDVKTAKDVEGKTVGVPGINNFIHVLMVKWLGDNGADPAKVHFVEAPMPQMADLLHSGQIDAATPVEPITTRLLGGGAGKLVSYYTDGLPVGTSAYILLVGGAYASAHPATVKALRASLDEGLAYYRTHPEEIDVILAKYLHFPIEILRASPKAQYDNQITRDQVAFWIDAMKKQKLTSRDLDPASLIVP